MLLYAILAVLLIVAIVPEVKRHDARKLQSLIDGDGSGVRRFDAGNEDLLPMRLDDGLELLPAAHDAPVIRIGGASATAPGYTVERREAIHAATVETAVWVPGLQALFTATAAAICAGLLSWALAWSWRVPVVVFALSLALGWLWRLRFADALLQRVETMTGLDLDHNGAVGRSSVSYAVANPATARAAVAAETRQTAESAERAAILAFVDKCFISGTPEAAHGIKAGGPDRNEYLRKRDVLLSLGVAKWRNAERPRAGWLMACSRERARQIVEKHVL